MDQNHIIIKANQVNFQNFIFYPDIEIMKNEIVFLSGRSGAGKSTFLKILNKTVSLTSGEVLYFGENIEQMHSLKLRKKILLVSQKAFLFPGTVEDNIRLFYEFREEPMIDRIKMQEFWDICCVPFDSAKESAYLSGGEKQRVFLAIMLSFQPKVLLLDEPTSALDRETAHQVMEQIREYCRKSGITVIAVSHDKDMTERFADREIYLDERRQENHK